MSKRKVKRTAGTIVRVLILAAFLLSAILPLFWIFITSFKGETELYAYPLVYWPKHPTFAAYKRLFSYSNFGQYFLNSLTVTLSSSAVAMVLAPPVMLALDPAGPWGPWGPRRFTGVGLVRPPLLVQERTPSPETLGVY